MDDKAMLDLNLKKRVRRVWEASGSFVAKWSGWLAVLVTASLVGLLVWALLTGHLKSGFGEYIPSVPGAERAKSFWDILDLLIVPLALAVAALWFDRRTREREREAEARRAESQREAQEQRAQLNLESELDRSRELALQSCLDHMTALLLEHGLRTSEPEAEVRDIARARVLTAFRQLDGNRKGALLQFLHESKLVGEDAVLDLRQADLRKINLMFARLDKINLQGADLEGASLGHAQLQGANLTAAHLRDANLRGANLKGANLYGAILRNAFLFLTDLEGADLTLADLSGAQLYQTNVTDAQLKQASLIGDAVIYETFEDLPRAGTIHVD